MKEYTGIKGQITVPCNMDESHRHMFNEKSQKKEKNASSMNPLRRGLELV